MPIYVRLRAEVTVKVKANMQFKKIFEVAEVRAPLSRVSLTRSPYLASVRNDSAKILVGIPLHLPKHKSPDLGACRITQICLRR